jgi:uncharacterized membrane protein YgcG
MPPADSPERAPASPAQAAGRRSLVARHGAGLAAGCTTLLLLLILSALVPRRSLENGPPLPDNWFDDRAGWVSREFAAAKSTYLQSYVLQVLRLAVLVVIEPAVPAAGIEGYTTAAANSWQIGAKGADNGVVLFVFPSAHTVRLEVGYGLEGVLPDIDAKHLVEATLLPQFSAGRYEAGFEDFLTALLARLQEHADEAAKADKPVGIVTFAAGIVRKVPRLARQGWQIFQANDLQGRLVMTAFAAVIGAAFAEGLFRVAVGLWALVQLPWRIAKERALRRIDGPHLASEFTPAQLARRPPPSLVAAALALHAGDIVAGAMALVAVVVGIAFLGLGSSFFMGGHGQFSGAGITAVWSPR